MKSTMKKVINICALLSCVLILFAQTQVMAADSTAPILQIRDYYIDEGALTPGGTVTINVSVTNSSKTVEATDAVLTLVSETGVVYPVYGEDNQIVLGTIGPGKTVVTSIPLNVSKYFRDEVVAIQCNFSYFAKGNAVSNQVMIAIPSTTGYSLNISAVKVAEHTTVGAKSLINFEITNIGANEIKDAVILVSGDVDEETKTIELGTIAANKQYLKDYYVSFNSVGEQTIQLTLNYTDSNGEPVSIDQGTYTVEVDESSAAPVLTEETTIIGTAGYIVAGVVGVIVCIIVILYIKKHM